MNTNVNSKDLTPGRLVDFKRQPGRGRPSLGKVISAGPRIVHVENTLGSVEKIKPSAIIAVRSEQTQHAA